MANGHGGVRPGAGRKKRIEEEELIEKLSPLEPYFIEALTEGIKLREPKPMDIFAKYFWGEPVKRVETKIEGHLSGLAVEIINKIDEANDTSK